MKHHPWTLGLAVVLASVAGCKNSVMDRSLYFFTGTNIGIEVAVNPADPNGPAKLVLGYKRAEGVINPVYDRYGTEAGQSACTGKGPKYRNEAYSVLAKISGDTSAGAVKSAKGTLSGAQWFATGEAAKLLARQPGIAGAVTGSAKIAEAVAAKSQVGSLFKGEGSEVGLRLLWSVYEDLTGHPESRTPAQNRFLSLLDRAAVAVKIPEGVNYYLDLTDTKDGMNIQCIKVDSGARASIKMATGFQRPFLYNKRLSESLRVLARVNPPGDEAPSITYYKTAEDSAQPVELTPLVRSWLKSEWKVQTEYHERLLQTLATDPAMLQAIEVLCDEILLTQEEKER